MALFALCACAKPQDLTDIHLLCLHSDIEVSLPKHCKLFAHLLPVPSPNPPLEDAVTAPSNPSWRQITCAFCRFHRKALLQNVPQVPLISTSTRPYEKGGVGSPTNRTIMYIKMSKVWIDTLLRQELVKLFVQQSSTYNVKLTLLQRELRVKLN